MKIVIIQYSPSLVDVVTIRNILFISFFLCTRFITGQEVLGYVFDSKTKEPLPGASVYFDGSSMGTITNLDGQFKLQSTIKTHATLIISHLGYVTKK